MIKPAVQVELGIYPLLHRRVLKFANRAKFKIEIRDLGSNRSHSRLKSLKSPAAVNSKKLRKIITKRPAGGEPTDLFYMVDFG